MSGSALHPYVRSEMVDPVQMILCPFAGASSSAFTGWRTLGDIGINVSLAMYPGHGYRMSEPPCTKIESIAQELAVAIATMNTVERQSLILAGHSMGAQIAFETCVCLEALDLSPAGLLLSGCHAPHLKSRRRLSHLNDQAFIQELLAIGGCSPELHKNPAMLSPFLPLLRADFSATETYSRHMNGDRRGLKTPALLLYGSHDIEANQEEVTAWKEWIGSECRLEEMPGSHFYITERPRAFVNKAIAFYFHLMTRV